MPNVVPIGTNYVPVSERMVEDLDHADFCALLECHCGNSTVTHINGLTIIQMPRAIAIANGDRCTLLRQTGTNMDAYINLCLAELDVKTAAA